MTKHTPGPWKLVSEEIEDKNGHLIAGVTGGSGYQYTDEEANQECHANAVLIAAAPELLTALREIVSQIDQGGEDGKVFGRDACIKSARAAIAKATGQP